MKRFFIIIILLFILLPIFSVAQARINNEKIIEAEIVKITASKEITRDNGTKLIQQDIQLKGLSGSFKDKEFTYYGINDLDVLSMTNLVFKEGDRVTVNVSQDANGKNQFYITNYIRRGYLYWLAAIFAITIIIVGRKKGLKSLISLVLSFFIIVKFIIPQIIAGSNPLVISIIGSAIILGMIVYITEGWKWQTHIASLSIFLSLIITFLLSYIFVILTKLTGFSSEEASFLAGMSNVNIIDFRGLLLAGVLIGTLGVLDDVILGQIEAVKQIKELNPYLSNKKVIKSASQIGRTHLSSMVNTLFLTYAGAALPLLILFSANNITGLTFFSAIDNELLATEIVRTLSGSIGLILSFPISTYLATYLLKIKPKNKN